MAVAFDKKRTREFVLPSDSELPPEQQTTWLMVALSQAEMDEITAIGQDEKKTPMQKLREAVSRSLVGWKNYPMSDGTEAPFVKTGANRPSDETLNLISARDLVALVTEITAKEGITPDEAGKS